MTNGISKYELNWIQKKVKRLIQVCFSHPTVLSMKSNSCPRLHVSNVLQLRFTRDILYVRRVVDLLKTTKINTYIIFIYYIIFESIDLLSIYAGLKLFKMHCFNDF